MKSFGLDIKYFDPFTIPFYLLGQSAELDLQTENCINQWDTHGCIDLVYNDNFPSIVLAFSDDENIFPISTAYGRTVYAISGFPEDWQFEYYRSGSPTGFDQTAVFLNSSDNFPYDWSLALENPGAEYAPFTPVMLHELGHLIGLGHISNTTGDYLMSLSRPHNQFLFQLTECDETGLSDLCDFNGTPVGVEDGIYIESGPSTFSPGNNITYTARFQDIPPSSYMYNWDWEINLLHAEGSYNYISGSTTGWNYTEWIFTAPAIPAGYCWFRDENNNVQAVVKVSGIDSDNAYHEAFKFVGILNVPTYTSDGALTNNESWCGDVTLKGNVTVPSGITLKIYPAANIKFNNGSSLTVHGTLDASGIPFGKIIFSRDGTSGSWGTITFDGSSSANSVLDNVEIEYGTGIRCLNGADITIQNSSIENCTYGIYLYNSEPDILYNNIYDVTQDAIFGEASGKSPLILGNTITRTTGTSYQGIYLLNNTDPFITFNDISGFQNGIYLGGGVTSFFSDDSYSTYYPNNRIRNSYNGLTVGWGSYVWAGNAELDIGWGNSIDNNNYDVWVYQSSTLLAHYNYWGGGQPAQYVDGTSYLGTYPVMTSDPWGGEKFMNNKKEIVGNLENPRGFDLENIRLGIALERSGNIQGAIIHYKSMIGRNDFADFALLRLASIKNRHTVANIRSYFETLLNVNSSYKPKLLNLLADIYLSEDMYEEAMQFYNLIIAGYPNSYDATNALFEKFFAALHHANDLTLASQLLSQLQSLNITNEDFLMRLEVAEFMLNNSSGSLFKGGIAESENKGSNLPKEYSLLGNYPNPFNPSTTISYALPYQSSVELVIYDIMGAIVKSFNVSSQSSGYQSILWDGRNENGNPVASGIYLYRLQLKSLENNETFIKTAKLMMLK